MTANSRELNPASHAKAKTKNTIKLLIPPGFDNFDLIFSLFVPASAIFSDSVSALHVLSSQPMKIENSIHLK